MIMSDIRRTMEDSLALYQRLQHAMDVIEKKLPLLDVEATVRATEELEGLHGRIRVLDRNLLEKLHPGNVGEIADQVERRKVLLAKILEHNRTLLPKLKSRLAGYRDELLRIRSGITSMQGYQHNMAARGQRIDSVN